MKKELLALFSASLAMGYAGKTMPGADITPQKSYGGKKTGKRKAYRAAKPAGTGKKIYRYARSHFK